MPRVKLSSAVVADLPVSLRSATIHRDAELRGFAVRITGDARTYIVEGTVRGTGARIRYALASAQAVSCDEARRRARALLGRMAEGYNPVVAERETREAERRERERQADVSAVTLRIAVSTYLDARPKLKERTRVDYRKAITQHLGDWLDRPIVEIRRSEIEHRYRALVSRKLVRRSRNGRVRHRKDKDGRTMIGGAATASHTFRALRAVLNFACEHFRDERDMPILAANPVRTLSALRLWQTPQARTRTVSVERLGLLLEALDDPGLISQRRISHRRTVCDLLKLLMFTGCRLREGANLEWSDVNLDRSEIVFRLTKNGSDHVIPVPPTVAAMLKRRHDDRERDNAVFVFPAATRLGRVDNVSKAVATISERIGLRFTPHDLRRTFATIAGVYLGFDESRVKRLLNHKPQGVTAKHYVARQTEALRRDLLAVEDYILKCSGRRASATVVGIETMNSACVDRTAGAI